MFAFEKDVSCRLLVAARKQLPDSTKVRLQIVRSNRTHTQFQQIVVGMVRRGDFNAAVKQLADILTQIAVEHSFNFRESRTEEQRLAIDSLLVVLEALLVAFTERLILQELMPADVRYNDSISTLGCFITWGKVSIIPALEPAVATQIVNFAIRVMPAGVVESPISATLSLSIVTKLADRLLSVLQYIYTSSPVLIHEYMNRALAEWVPPAALELLILRSPDAEAFEQYLRMVRLYLPRLDSKSQAVLMELACVSVGHFVLANPKCSGVVNRNVIAAATALITWIEKLRAFRPLRTFRAHEATLISIIELTIMAAEKLSDGPELPRPISDSTGSAGSSTNRSTSSDHIHSPSSNRTPGASVIASPTPLHMALNTSSDVTHSQYDGNLRVKSPVSGKSKNFELPEHNLGFTVDDSGTSTHRNKSQTVLLSIANTKAFIRGKSLLVKRDSSSSDKRIENRISASIYTINMIYVSVTVSQRPGGEPYAGITHELQSYLPILLEKFGAYSRRTALMLLVVLSQCSKKEYFQLLPRLPTDMFLEFIRTMQLCLRPHNFACAMREVIDLYCSALSDELEKTDKELACNSLNMFITIPGDVIPLDVSQKLLNLLSTYITNSKNLNHEMMASFEYCIEKLYTESRQDPSLLSALVPLVPYSSLAEALHNMCRIRGLMLFLKLMAHGKLVIPARVISGGPIGVAQWQSSRTKLMLCLCADTDMESVHMAIKCLELLQGDNSQSAAQRDIISEVLDSMEYSSPSIKAMRARMLSFIAAVRTCSFKLLKNAVSDTIKLADVKQLPNGTYTNLLLLNAALSIHDPPEVRQQFYLEFAKQNNVILSQLEDAFSTIHIDVAIEFFQAVSKSIEQNHSTGAERGTQYIDKSYLITWLLKCLKTKHPLNSAELGLGRICGLAVSALTPVASVSAELQVLKLVKVVAEYATADTDRSVATEFSDVVQFMLRRNWQMASLDTFTSALAILFESYKVPDEEGLHSLAIQVSNLSIEFILVIRLLTPLLRTNLRFALRFCDQAVSLNDASRAAGYAALTRDLSLRTGNQFTFIEKADLVVFLLKHSPVLKALCDVCSIAGNESLSVSLLDLFTSYTPKAERTLIALAVNHEVESTKNESGLFRSNSITMRLILKWLRASTRPFLHEFLASILGSLRTASLQDDETPAHEVFSELTFRYGAAKLPISVLWFFKFVKEAVEVKFGAEAADSALANLLCLRFVCPAIITPHQYGLIAKAPNRDFAAMLRKYAVYLQQHKFELKDVVLSAVKSESALNNCHTAMDYDAIITDAEDHNNDHSKIADIHQYTSSTRQVFHTLRRHAIEVRVVLLSRGNGNMVASMMRYLRMGKIRTPNNARVEEACDSDSDYRIPLRGSDVILAPATALMTDNYILASDIVGNLLTFNLPLLMDFSNFLSLADLWSEFFFAVAFTAVRNLPHGLHLIVLNCPQEMMATLLRLAGMASLLVEVESLFSADFADSVDDIPLSLKTARDAAIDIRSSVEFIVKLKEHVSTDLQDATLFVGTEFFQIRTANGYSIIPYNGSISGNDRKPISVVLEDNNNVLISCAGFEIELVEPSQSLLRIMELSLSASKAVNYGATIELSKKRELHQKLEIALTFSDVESDDDDSILYEEGDGDSMRVKRDSHRSRASSLSDFMGEISPGRVLLSTLVDTLSPLAAVRSCALELYAVLPEALGLQLSIPSPHEALEPSQVYSLSQTASLRHPELAGNVVSGLVSLGTDITEHAARIIAPWIPLLTIQTAEDRIFLREHILKPLFKLTANHPHTVAPLLLDHFWPLLQGMSTLIAELLLETLNETEDAEARESLRLIATHGLSHSKPTETRALAELMLSKLLTAVRNMSTVSPTNFYSTDEWKDVYSSALVFGSIPLDFKSAEALFPDMVVILMILVRSSDFCLHNTLYQMFINYVNSVLQSTQISASQRYRLRAVRAVLNEESSLDLFGVSADGSNTSSIPSTKIYWNNYTSEHAENLGKLVAETTVSIFGGNLNRYQETRVTIAASLVEYMEIPWAPLQRRCILGLLGAVNFFMPEYVVANLLRIWCSVLSVSSSMPYLDSNKAENLELQGIIIDAMLRTFAGTIECVPETGTYQTHMFWVAVVTLATGCMPLLKNAVLLLKETVKIEHFRGAFVNRSLPDVFLNARPTFLDNISELLVLDLPINQRNFHVAVAELLILPFQAEESNHIVIECCEVLANACPKEFLYVGYLYLGGEYDKLITKVPTGAFVDVDVDNTVVEWLAMRVKLEEPSTIMSLAFCAKIAGSTRTADYITIGERLLDLVKRIPSRKAVSLVAPLLRPAILRLLVLGDENIDMSLVNWTLAIFSRSDIERHLISANSRTLVDLVKSLDVQVFFDSKLQLVLFDQSDKFTENARKALGDQQWILTTSAHRSENSENLYESEQLF